MTYSYDATTSSVDFIVLELLMQPPQHDMTMTTPPRAALLHDPQAELVSFSVRSCAVCHIAIARNANLFFDVDVIVRHY